MANATLRLLDLPKELQQLVFAEYFEPFDIEITQHSELESADRNLSDSNTSSDPRSSVKSFGAREHLNILRASSLIRADAHYALVKAFRGQLTIRGCENGIHSGRGALRELLRTLPSQRVTRIVVVGVTRHTCCAGKCPQSPNLISFELFKNLQSVRFTAKEWLTIDRMNNFDDLQACFPGLSENAARSLFRRSRIARDFSNMTIPSTMMTAAIQRFAAGQRARWKILEEIPVAVDIAERHPGTMDDLAVLLSEASPIASQIFGIQAVRVTINKNCDFHACKLVDSDAHQLWIAHGRGWRYASW